MCHFAVFFISIISCIHCCTALLFAVLTVVIFLAVMAICRCVIFVVVGVGLVVVVVTFHLLCRRPTLISMFSMKMWNVYILSVVIFLAVLNMLV